VNKGIGVTLFWLVRDIWSRRLPASLGCVAEQSAEEKGGPDHARRRRPGR